MKDVGPQPAESVLVDGRSHVDIEAIIEQIYSDLGGVTSRSDIREALMEVTPAYTGARIKTYVPILLRKDVLRRLQGGFAHHQGAMAPKSDNADSAREETAESAKKYKRPELMPARTG